MDSEYGKWYEEFKDSFENLDENNLSEAMNNLIFNAASTISMNRKLMEKTIDVSWVEAIENGILHVDNCVRHPSKTIVDVEEIVPIALSKRATVESVKHLAQHTDLIQSVDPRTGQITPSHLLNVHKEESLLTYENKFVNTLIDRLYIFIITRYEKLSQVSKDEEVYTLDFDIGVNDKNGESMQMKISIDTTKSLETKNDQGLTIWQRVEKLKKTIEGYKGSELCQTLGNNFVRPPIMRTNAIMKNVDLKACLNLWQYILSYDKTGYEINIEDMALKPDEMYMDDLKKLIACNLLLFKSYTGGEDEDVPVIGKRKLKSVKPRIVKKYGRELLSGSYNVHANETVGYLAEDGEHAFVKSVPENTDDIFEQIDKAIEIEQNYYKVREKKRLEKIAAEEEAERKRKEREARIEEKRRIEEAKREERERIKREREEERRRIQEMLEKRRKEIEAAERERARLEEERLKRIEEEKRLEEEARKKREEEERIAAERERIARQNKDMRTELGGAEGIDVDSIDRAKFVNESNEVISKITDDEVEEAEVVIEKVKNIKIAKEEATEMDVALGIVPDEHDIIAENHKEKDKENETEEEKLVERLSESFENDDNDEEEIDEEKISEIEKAMENENVDDPKLIVARMKLEQQKREKVLREEERAARLKAERTRLESKTLKEIRKQYSYNPVYLIPRIFMKLLFVLFGYIPKDTDNPDQVRILERRKKMKVFFEELSEGREKMEVYYKKYAPNTKYRVRRDIDDIKFKRKKRKAAKNSPKPAYVPPKRTLEEQKAINAQMKKYYKEYHINIFKRIYRWAKSKTKAEQEKAFKRALGEK
ncbi:protein of unknown function [Lachnospiraceae bacterium RM5]|nr:protein of unknown function [Lachnospiraceae bacterium RM5]